MNLYWKNNNFLLIDTIISAVLSILLVGLHLFYANFSIELDDSILSIVGSISGSLIGFMISALAIIMALLGEKTLDLLIQNNYHKEIIEIFISTIAYLGILTLLILIAFLIKDYSSIYFLGYFLTFFFISVFRVQKSLWVLIEMMKLTNKIK